MATMVMNRATRRRLTRKHRIKENQLLAAMNSHLPEPVRMSSLTKVTARLLPNWHRRQPGQAQKLREMYAADTRESPPTVAEVGFAVRRILADEDLEEDLAHSRN